MNLCFDTDYMDHSKSGKKQLSLVMRKHVFGDLRPGKTQTGLLTYRD